MKQRITKRVVDGLKPSEKRFYVWDMDVTGFGLQVTPKGAKSYVFQYRLPGRGRSTSAKRIMIGRHGDLAPDQARRIAAEHLLAVKAGANPALGRKPSELPRVAELAQRFLNEHLPTKKKPPRQSTIDGYESIFRKHVVPRIGSKHVEAVTTADVERLHNAMRATPYVANRTLSLLQQAFDQAERWGWRPQHSNPALHMDKYVEARRGSKKEVMLSAEQMARLLEAIDTEGAAGASPIACNAIRVAFWTGWRIGEVLALEWDNVNLEHGVAKLLRTKASEEEYRQIPAEALVVLSQGIVNGGHHGDGWPVVPEPPMGAAVPEDHESLGGTALSPPMMPLGAALAFGAVACGAQGLAADGDPLTLGEDLGQMGVIEASVAILDPGQNVLP